MNYYVKLIDLEIHKYMIWKRQSRGDFNSGVTVYELTCPLKEVGGYFPIYPSGFLKLIIGKL